MAKMVRHLPVAGFPGYRVGGDGSVWTCWKRAGGTDGGLGVYSYVDESCWRMLSLTPDKDGYLTVKLYRGGKQFTRKVARLVLEHFIGPCPPGHEASHKNGVKTDNAAGNLGWATHADNERDKERHGTRLVGEKHPHATLTDEQVQAMLADRATGRTLEWLGKKYNVSFQHAGLICSGRRRKASRFSA